MKIHEKDSDEKIRKLFLNEVNRLDLDIDSYEVDRAHRTGRSYVDKKGKRHTPVIVRFTSWRARNCFYEARRESNLYVKADLTARRQSLLAQALDLHESDSKISKFIQYIFIDRNCHLTLKTTDGRLLHFNPMEEFLRLPDYIKNTLPPYLAINKAITNDLKRIGEEHILVILTDVDIEDWLKDEKNYYIGRDHGVTKGSKFQNPFSLNDFDRPTAIKMFRDHINANPVLKNEVESLRSKKLGCFCYPEDCHGQVLIDILYN